jgi:hypothetical protein
MNKLIIIIFVQIFGFQILFCQSIPSSCLAPDSIINKYKIDSEKLAFRKIIRQGLDEKDSIIIPQSHIDTVLNALIAVYNASSLLEVDSVINIFDIRAIEPRLNSIMITADTNLAWMKSLRIDVFPTGNSYIDSLIEIYKFKVETKGYWKWFFVFKSEYNYNLNPIIATLKNIEGISSAEINRYIGDGNDIIDSVGAEFVELIYSYGWGDCPNGCAYKHYWKFRVFYDCSVEFVESYGTPFDITNVKQVSSNEKVSVFPNPFVNSIFVRGINSEFQYSIYNLLGQKIQSGDSDGEIIIEDPSNFSEKIYFLKIISGDKMYNFKILRN